MRFIENVAGFGIAAACLLVVLQVVLPYFPSLSMPWIPEVERYLVIYSVYVAAGVVFVRGGHIAVEFVVDRLPAKWQRAIDLFGVAVGMVFSLVVGVLALKWVAGERTLGAVTTSGIELPVWMVQIAVPLGLLMLAGFMGWRLVQLVRGKAERRQELSRDNS